METTPTQQDIPLFENTGLTELEKAWKIYSGTDIHTLIRITEEQFQQGTHAVALFLADRILKEKNPDPETRVRLRFIRAECFYEFKFYRQAYPDYVFYIKQRGENDTLRAKLRYCKRMIHTGNIGTLIFIAVSTICLVIMFWALYFVQVKYPEDFDMGINLEYVQAFGIAGTAMLLFGLFYRYGIISRMK